MKESMCKYKGCFINLFCFKSTCIEKLASRLFKTIFIIMIILLVMNLYVVTSACVNNTIPFWVYIYNVIFDILLFIIGLGLFRLLLEIPVVLHRILDAITSKEISCSDDEKE